MAIDLAIEKTRQDQAPLTTPDQIISLFLLSKKTLYSPLDSEGEKAMFRMGMPFGFNLLHDFSGMTYIFFGNFTAIRPEIVIWRLQMLNELLNERRSSMKERIGLKLVTEQQVILVESLFAKLKVWLLVTSDEDKAIIMSETANALFYDRVQIFSTVDVKRQLSLIS